MAKGSEGLPKVSDEYKQQRKNLILKSAQICFAEKGFRETTVDDIVEHSKTSKGTIYIYFKSKEEIYFELIEEKFGNSLEHYFSSVRKLETAEQKLRYIIQLQKNIEFTEEEQRFIMLQIETNIYLLRKDNSEQFMIERLDRVSKFLEEIINEGITTGEFNKEIHAPTFSKMFWSIQDGLITRGTSKQLSKDHKPIWEMVEEMMFHYLKT